MIRVSSPLESNRGMLKSNPDGYSRQHFLYFFPLPQGQGSFRPTFVAAFGLSDRGGSGLKHAHQSIAATGSSMSMVVWQPSAVIGIARLVSSEPLESWKAYLVFRAIEHVSDVLPRAFVA